MCHGACCSEWSSGDTNEPVADELGTRGKSCDQDGGHAADNGGGGSHGSQRGKLEFCPISFHKKFCIIVIFRALDKWEYLVTIFLISQ